MAVNNPYALSFDGVDDYIDCGNPNILDVLSPPFTLEATINTTNSSSTTNGILMKIASSTTRGYGFYLDSGKLTSYIGSKAEGVTGTTTVSDGVPHVLSVVVTTTEIINYVDGVEDGRTSFTGAIQSGAKLYIGARQAGGFYFDGSIDEVRIWNQGLTQTEIQNNSNKKLRGDENGLIAYYHFDEGTGSTVYDSTSNANHGTIYGATFVNGIVDLIGNVGADTIAASNISYNQTTVNGELYYTDYANTDVWIEYSNDPTLDTDGNLLNVLGSSSVQTLTTTGTFSETITGLNQNTQYYFQAIAKGV